MEKLPYRYFYYETLQKKQKTKFNFTKLNKMKEKRQFFHIDILYIYVSDIQRRVTDDIYSKRVIK